MASGAATRSATVVPFGPASPRASLGHRGDRNLQASFPASPLNPITGDYTVGLVEDIGNAAFKGAGGPGDSVANIDVTNGVVNDGGYFFGSYGLNFSDAPNLGDVETGGEGLPAGAYVPNPTSPGPGSVSPFDQAPYSGLGIFPTQQYGSGLGSAVSPSDTAPGVARATLHDYIKGRSYAGSDGRS